MATRTKTTVYGKLCQRLGELEKERRTILKELKNSPEHIIKYVNDLLKDFASKGHWFSRTNEKKEIAYFRVSGYALNDKAIRQTEKSSVLISGNITWDTYTYAGVKTQVIDAITISAFNDIEPQILNGRVHAPTFSEKTILKNALTAKKKELEEELKKVKLEMAAI